ncbi:MAG TPA: hypothetical protein VGG79_26105 [Roseiarcus sp.]|jgi:hypothetical protein
MVAVAAQIVNLPLQAIPARLNLGEEAAQAFDLSLQHRGLRRFIGHVTRRVDCCGAIAGNIGPAPLG